MKRATTPGPARTWPGRPDPATIGTPHPMAATIRNATPLTTPELPNRRAAHIG
ncbi:hypothetical protein OG588_03610 [Streptomyces prunicolor]|uniref:hypothetical protein n=1 Tax=Streptomyces prunicolor TaxID=67348 RepID=UPI00386AE5B9|nr:hypothetical protein OG588_03610 [Streptomyces prunicolor]